MEERVQVAKGTYSTLGSPPCSDVEDASDGQSGVRRRRGTGGNRGDTHAIRSATVPADKLRTLLDDDKELSDEYPKGVWFLLGYIFLQSWSYFGLTSVMVLFFHFHEGAEEEDAVEYVHYFISTTFVFSMVGGWLSDAKWGKYKTIYYSLLLWVSGAVLLIVDSYPSLRLGEWLAILSMAMMAIGKGMATPCNGSLLGDQFDGVNPALASTVFSALIWAITVGSMATKFTTPYIRTHSPLHYFGAFLTTGVFIGAALTVYRMGRRHYRVTQCQSNPLAQMYDVIRIAYRKNNTVLDAEHWMDYAKPELGAEPVEEVKQAWKALKVFLPLPFFWSLQFQTYSTWVLQADEMNRSLTKTWEICPDQTLTLGPMFSLMLIPLLEKVIYPAYERFMPLVVTVLWRKPLAILFPRYQQAPLRSPYRPLPLQKLGFGIMCGILAFLQAARVQDRIDLHGQPARSLIDGSQVGGVPVLAQLPQQFIMSLGEMLVGVNGLDFAYSQAPASMKSVMTAFWYLTVGVGNVLVSLFANLQSDSCDFGCRSNLYAGLLTVFWVIFVGLAMRYRYIDEDDGDDIAKDALSKRGKASGARRRASSIGF